MATPRKLEWDEAGEQWVPATGKPGASYVEWNGIDWVEGKNPEGPGALKRGLVSGFEGLKGTAMELIPALAQQALGYEEAAQRNLAAYKKRMDELAAKGLSSRVTYEDVKDVGTALSFLGEAVGEALPSLALTAATAGAGGAAAGAAKVAESGARFGAGRLLASQVAKREAAILAERQALGEPITAAAQQAAREAAVRGVSQLTGQAGGAFLGSSLLNVPESFQSLADDGVNNVGAAFVVGTMKSMLDTIGPVRLLAKTRGTDFSDKLTDVISARLLKGRPGISGAIGGTLETMALEGLTEGTQELLDQAASAILADKTINWNEIINAGLKGGVGAGPVGGVAGAMGARSKAAAEAQRAQTIEENQRKAAEEQALQERMQRAIAGREAYDRQRAEDQQAYVAQRLMGEVEVPERAPNIIEEYRSAFSDASNAFDGAKFTFKYRKDKTGEVLTEKEDLLPLGVRKGDPIVQRDAEGNPIFMMDPQDVMVRAQSLVQQKVVDPETGKPFTVASARKAVERMAQFEVNRALTRRREDVQAKADEDFMKSREVTLPSLADQPPVVRNRLEEARKIIREVHEDPSLLDNAPGMRPLYEDALRTHEEARFAGFEREDAQRRQALEERRELGPMVGQPFTGTPMREAPAPTLTQEETQALQGAGLRLDQIARMPYEEARTRAQVAMREEQERAQPTQPPTPKLGQQGTITLENALKEVPPGGTVSLPALQNELQRAGIRDVGMQELKQILEGYAPAKNVTPAGMLRVPESMRLVRSKDGTFRKPRSGTQEEAFRGEIPELRGERGGARAFPEAPQPLPSEISSPTREVQGPLQNPPLGLSQDEWAEIHNKIVRRGTDKLLTLDQLEIAAGREFNPKGAAQMWEGLINSQAVKKEGLGYRVRGDAPIVSRFAPEVVGGPTTAKPKPVEEAPTTYTPPKTPVPKEKTAKSAAKPESKTFPADSFNESKIFKTWEDLQKHIDSGMDIIVYRGVRWNVDPDESDPKKMAKRETTQYGYFWSPSYHIAAQYSRGLGQAFGEPVKDGEVYAMRIPAKTMAEAVRTEQEIPLQQINRLTALRQNILADEGIEFVIPPRLHGKRIKLSADLDFSELNKAVRKLENAEPVTSKIEPISSKMRYDLFKEGLTGSQISELTEAEAKEYLRNVQKAKELMSEGEIPQGTSKSGKDVIDKTMKRMRKQDKAAEKGIPDDYSCG